MLAMYGAVIDMDEDCPKRSVQATQILVFFLIV